MLKYKLDAISKLQNVLNFKYNSTNGNENSKQEARQTILSYLKKMNRTSKSKSTTISIFESEQE